MLNIKPSPGLPHRRHAYESKSTITQSIQHTMAGHFRGTNGVNGDSRPQAFSDAPQFSGFMKPCRFEGEVRHLEVKGSIPTELDGCFYRVMPDPQIPSRDPNDPVNQHFTPASLKTRVLMTALVVQRRWKCERFPYQGRRVPLQAEIRADGEVCSRKKGTEAAFR